MRNRTSTNLSFVGRFTLLFGAMYALSALLFRGVLSLLPEDAGTAIRFFEPYSLSQGPVLGAFVIWGLCHRGHWSQSPAVSRECCIP